MSFKIRCRTLFDITKTGVRRRPQAGLQEAEVSQWELKRKEQCNLDTLIQVISLRSQPEDISDPVSSLVKLNKEVYFGFLYEETEVPQKMWSFDFIIAHPSVFSDGITELGALYDDCDGVPMIKIGTEWELLSEALDSSPELRNIYFEII